MNELQAYKMVMAPPVVLDVESADGKTKARIDVYEARRMLEEAAKEVTETARWFRVRLWLANRLETMPELLAESTAIEFNNTVMAIVDRVNEERKKKVESIVSSPQPIPVSQDGCC